MSPSPVITENWKHEDGHTVKLMVLPEMAAKIVGKEFQREEDPLEGLQGVVHFRSLADLQEFSTLLFNSSDWTQV